MWYTYSSVGVAFTSVGVLMTELVWNRAFDLLMQNEGGYVNDPNDKGGETQYGISKKQYPYLDIPSITLEQAKDIYHNDYWFRYKCECFPDCISICLFDAVVMSNGPKMIKLLQESLGVTADGIIGNQTIGAAHRIPLKPVVNNFCEKRLNYLKTLKSWKHYANGWGARVLRVKQTAEDMI